MDTMVIFIGNIYGGGSVGKSSLPAGYFSVGALARLSRQIASVGSDHHAKKWRSQPVD